VGYRADLSTNRLPRQSIGSLANLMPDRRVTQGAFRALVRRHLAEASERLRHQKGMNRAPDPKRRSPSRGRYQERYQFASS